MTKYERYAVHPDHRGIGGGSAVMRPVLASAIAAACLALPTFAIEPNANETALASLIASDAGQQRATMTFHPLLNMVARFRARDMATRSYFNHLDPDGYGPNYIVRLAELDLPRYYGQDKTNNYIESIAGGNATAQATFAQWMASSGHKLHVLGESAFYREQTYYGVGYYYDARALYHHYWSFISTPPDVDAALSVYVEWLFDRLTPFKIDDPTSDPDDDGFQNLMEYALNFNPAVADTNACFAFAYNPETGAGEMTVPIRQDLDAQVGVAVQTTTNLGASAWTTNGVKKTANVFTAESSNAPRFFRLNVTRTVP